MRYRITRKRKYLKSIIDKNQYFDKKIVSARSGDVFVDCGAFDGITIKDYVNFNKQFGHVYAFELDKVAITKMHKFLNLSADQITVFPCGVWSEKKTMHFSENGMGTSHLDEENGFEVPVDSIDNCIGENRVDFIKMDIEGAEMAALRGAENTIRKNKPTLAICLYHKATDYYEIPLYISGLVPEYKFFVRHYSDNLAETVLYAVM